MALDIAKFGRKPYQKFERPDVKQKSGVHIKRYFSTLFGKVLGLLIPVSAFLVPFWIWDFGLKDGIGRTFVWLILSGIILIIGSIVLLLRNAAVKASQTNSFIILLLALVLISFSIGSFANMGIIQGLGISLLSARLAVCGILAGIIWLLSLAYIHPNPGFIKSIFVSFFIGSTILVVYSLMRLFFGGGYEAIEFLPAQGWLLIFTINSFLLLSFAMFQKKFVKAIWTTSLSLHLLFLFAYDKMSIWIVLLIGISALLLFQIIYSKKLWQRNFTYPLQIFIIVFLLLIIPVKLFTGKSVPDMHLFSYSDVQEAASSRGLSFFGEGVSRGADFTGLQLVSFLNFEEEGNFAITENEIEHGYLQIFIETGLFGLLAWLALILFFLVSGIRFLRNNFESLREGDMPEEVYLGSIFWVAIIMLAIGTWFTPFSAIFYWFCMVVFGSALVFWSKTASSSVPRAKGGQSIVLAAFLRIFSFVMILLSVIFIVIIIRVMSAAFAARDSAVAQNSQEALDGWNKAATRNPWNKEYQLRAADQEVKMLQIPVALDVQKESLERVTEILRDTSESSSALVHWFAATIYMQMEAYAEGTSSIVRDHYIKAMNLWPKNVVIPVSIAQFYRDYSDSIVSHDVSAVLLRVEAREALEKALNLEEEYLPARLELALIFEQEDGAIRALQELEPWENASPEIKYHVGRLYFNDGDFATASEKFAAVIRAVPSHSNARYSLAVSYFRLQQYDDSLLEFEEVLRLNPDNEDLAEKINQVKEKLGE